MTPLQELTAVFVAPNRCNAREQADAIDALIKERIAQAAWALVTEVDRLKAQGYVPEFGEGPIRAALAKAWGDAT